MHGATVVQAREAVNTFLKNARDQDKRVVRIIHGKGNSSEGKLPVLKGKVNSWLRQKGEVLAFSPPVLTTAERGGVCAVETNLILQNVQHLSLVYFDRF